MKSASLIHHTRAASGSTQDSIIGQKPPIYNSSEEPRSTIPVWPPRERACHRPTIFKRAQAHDTFDAP